MTGQWIWSRDDAVIARTTRSTMPALRTAVWVATITADGDSLRALAEMRYLQQQSIAPPSLEDPRLDPTGGTRALTGACRRSARAGWPRLLARYIFRRCRPGPRCIFKRRRAGRRDWRTRGRGRGRVRESIIRA